MRLAKICYTAAMKRSSLLLLGFLCAVFVPLLFVSHVLGVSSDLAEELNLLNHQIEQKREKIKNLEANINQYKEKIQQKRLEAVSLSNQMSILENHIAQVELDIEATEQKRDALDLEIQSLELEITDAERTITRQRLILAELLRELRYQNRHNYLEIAVLYDNFSDFFDNVQYIRSVERDLGRSVESVKQSKEALESKKVQREERRDAYVALSEDLQDKKKDLEEQNFAKSDLLAQTRASELTFQTMVNRLRSEYQQIENEISGIEQEVRRRLAEQDKLSQLEERSGGDLLLSWPTQSRYITARFRDPDYPYRHIFEHNAIDIRAAHGTPLKAAASGYVAQARHCNSASCYAYVILIHADGLSTVYGHMSKISVSVDQFVTRGDIIGYSGGTPGTIGAGPFVTGPHLHFEVRKNGIPQNPLQFLVKDY